MASLLFLKSVPVVARRTVASACSHLQQASAEAGNFVRTRVSDATPEFRGTTERAPIGTDFALRLGFGAKIAISSIV